MGVELWCECEASRAAIKPIVMITGRQTNFSFGFRYSCTASGICKEGEHTLNKSNVSKTSEYPVRINVVGEIGKIHVGKRQIIFGPLNLRRDSAEAAAAI